MNHRQINTNFWDNDDYIFDLTGNEQILYLFFLTNGKANMTGIYELSKRRTLTRFPWITEAELEEIKKKFEVDSEYFFYKNWVYVTSKYRPMYSSAPNVVEAYYREFNLIPQEIKEYFFKKKEYEIAISHKGNLTWKLNEKKELEIRVTYKDKDKVKVKCLGGSLGGSLGVELNEDVDPKNIPF